MPNKRGAGRRACAASGRRSIFNFCVLPQFPKHPDDPPRALPDHHQDPYRNDRHRPPAPIIPAPMALPQITQRIGVESKPFCGVISLASCYVSPLCRRGLHEFGAFPADEVRLLGVWMLSAEEYEVACDLRRQGWSVSAIARRLGRDRKTVRAYLTGQRHPGTRACERGEFWRYRPYCQQRLEDDPHLQASVLHTEITALGYSGGYSTFTRAVREHLTRPRCPLCQDDHRYGTAGAGGTGGTGGGHRTGEDVRFDWLELPSPPAHWRCGTRAHVLLTSHTTTGRWRGTLAESRELPQFVEAMDHALRCLGGTGGRWILGRMPPVCSPRSGRLTAAFTDVARYYGTTITLRAHGDLDHLEHLHRALTQRWWHTLPTTTGLRAAQAALDHLAHRTQDHHTPLPPPPPGPGRRAGHARTALPRPDLHPPHRRRPRTHRLPRQPLRRPPGPRRSRRRNPPTTRRTPPVDHHHQRRRHRPPHPRTPRSRPHHHRPPPGRHRRTQSPPHPPHPPTLPHHHQPPTPHPPSPSPRRSPHQPHPPPQQPHQPRQHHHAPHHRTHHPPPPPTQQPHHAPHQPPGTPPTANDAHDTSHHAPDTTKPPNPTTKNNNNRTPTPPGQPPNPTPPPQTQGAQTQGAQTRGRHRHEGAPPTQRGTTDPGRADPAGRRPRT